MNNTLDKKKNNMRNDITTTSIFQKPFSLTCWNSSEGKFNAKKTTMQIDNRKKMVYAFMRPKNLKLHIMMK